MNHGLTAIWAASAGDAGYAMEELVAELGSAFLCADLDLTPELRRIMPPISPRGWTS